MGVNYGSGLPFDACYFVASRKRGMVAL